MDIPALPFWNSGKILRNPLTTSDSRYIGDHIKARRTALGLLQEDVARILKVTTDSVANWENKKAEPKIRYVPRIVAFLEYDPFPVEGVRFGDMVKRYRRAKGLSRKILAKMLGIDETRILSWENNSSFPKTEMRVKIEQIMKGG